MEKKLKIVITGAGGFVGQHLLEEMNVTDYVLTMITRNPTKKMRVLPSSVRVVQADLLNTDSLIAAFEGQDLLINLAAEVRNAELLEATNIRGTHNLLKAINHCGIKRVIHLSSVGIIGKTYSSSPVSVNEEYPAHPGNAYEKSKLISEQLFLEAAAKGSFELNVLRPTNVFGAYHPFNALLHLMQHIQAKRRCVYGDQAQVNYVYVKDLTAIIEYLVQHSVPEKILNVGSPMDLKDFYRIIGRELACEAKCVRIPSLFFTLAGLPGIRKLRTVLNRVQYTDEKLKSFFNYPYGVEKGLKETITHYRGQQQLPKQCK